MRPYFWGDCPEECYEVADHVEGCPTNLPNFKHNASGLEVRWYKYIGRSMEVSRDVTFVECLDLFAECARSLEDLVATGGKSN
jgi:hypothetical protein